MGAAMKFNTLRFRINFITLVYSLLLVVISSSIMYAIISDLIGRRIEGENTGFLMQMRDQLENEYRKLDSIATLFSPYGNLGELLSAFYANEMVGEKAVIMSDIKDDMGVITYSNPDILLCTFFFNEDYMDFIGTTVVTRDLDLESLPFLFSDFKSTFHGPHRTIKKIQKSPVISVKSDVDIGSSRDTFAYIEADFSRIGKQMDARAEEGYIYQIRNASGETLYATGEERPDGGYITYEVSSEQGWNITCLADPAAVKGIEVRLIADTVARYPLFLIMGLIFSLLLLQIIGRPLQRFKEGVIQMEKGDFEALIPLTGIMEFDLLIKRIQKAKQRIGQLMNEVREKEQRRAFAEISRLRAQISPHFVLNTLNSIHWMAQEKGQKEIDDTVLSLTKILSYNLQKTRFVAVIADELAAAEEYLKLQQKKYDIHYDIDCRLGEDGLQQEIPRFILQPLIENSILHGKGESIHINLSACYVPEGILLSLCDGGGRIDGEMLDYINNHKGKPEKLGIGLSYVFTALEAYYKRDDLIVFASRESGLEIRILLPHGGERDNEECDDCGR